MWKTLRKYSIMNGVSAITYRLFILIFFALFQLSCPDGSVFAAVKSVPYSLDVNGDGVKEDIFVDEKSGDVYVVDSAGKTLVRGSNLAVDGYSVFDGIKKAPDGNYGFVIVNRGGNFGARINNLISFIGKDFYLSKVSADVRNNVDRIIYSDVHCEIKPDLPFNRISADNVAQVLLPVEDKRFPQQCSENVGSYFKFSELEQGESVNKLLN
jgi:hypothetical protein